MTYMDKLSKFIDIEGYLSSTAINHGFVKFYIYDPNSNRANNISKIIEVGNDYVVVEVTNEYDITKYIIPLSRFVVVECNS